MTDRSLYEVLGVEQDATAEQIKAAYKRLLRTVHPDVGGSAALFSFVQDAWDTLSDPVKRAAYDKSRRGPRAADLDPEPPPPPPAPPRAAPRPVPTPVKPAAGSPWGRVAAGALGVLVLVGVVVAASSGGSDDTIQASDRSAEVPVAAEPVAPVPTTPPAEPVVTTAPAAPPSPAVVATVDSVYVELARLSAGTSCKEALSILPLDLGKTTNEVALRGAVRNADEAKFSDASWTPLATATRQALGDLLALEDGDDAAGESLLTQMETIDRLCTR